MRKPSGGQKTVRELLDQNGKDGDTGIDHGSGEKVLDNAPESRDVKEEKQRLDNHMKLEKNTDNRFLVDSKYSVQGPSFDNKIHISPHVSPLSPPRPMLYPQFIPMAPHFRGVAPIPFMIPQFGLQALGNPGMHHPLLSPTTKESKAEASFNSLLTDVKNSMEKSAIHSSSSKSSKPSSNSLPCVPPPSNHTQPPKGPITSPQVDESKNKPITPAHSHSVKRQYPYTDADRNLPGYGDTKVEKLKNSDTDLKRQKVISSSDTSVTKSSSGQFEMSALDLSMKTLRAQEERQQRGESLLFNTCFNKDGKSNPKSSIFEAPQDLSLRSSSSKNVDLPSSLSISASHRSVPLNVPHPRSTLDLTKSIGSSKPDNHRRDNIDSKPEVCLTFLCLSYFPLFVLLSFVCLTFLCLSYFPLFDLLSFVCLTFLCLTYFPLFVLLTFVTFMPSPIAQLVALRT